MFPTAEQLLVTLCATIGVLVAGIPIFIPSVQELFVVGDYVWALIFVVSNFQLDSHAVMAASVKAILAAWIGSGLGVLFYYLAGAILWESDLSVDLYSKHALATGLIGIALSLLKLNYWDISLLVGYSVAAFSGSRCVLKALSYGIGLTVGSLVTNLMLLFAYSVFPWSRKRNTLKESAFDFRLSHSLWFEALFVYFEASMNIHGEEVSRRQTSAADKLTRLIEVLALIKADPRGQLSSSDLSRIMS